MRVAWFTLSILMGFFVGTQADWTTPKLLAKGSIYLVEMHTERETGHHHILTNYHSSYPILQYYHLDTHGILRVNITFSHPNIQVFWSMQITSRGNGQDLYIIAEVLWGESFASEHVFTESHDDGQTWEPITLFPRHPLDKPGKRLSPFLLVIPDTGVLFVFFLDLEGSTRKLKYAKRTSRYKDFTQEQVINERDDVDTVSSLRCEVTGAEGKPLLHLIWTECLSKCSYWSVRHMAIDDEATIKVVPHEASYGFDQDPMLRTTTATYFWHSMLAGIWYRRYQYFRVPLFYSMDSGYTFTTTVAVDHSVGQSKLFLELGIAFCENPTRPTLHLMTRINGMLSRYLVWDLASATFKSLPQPFDDNLPVNLDNDGFLISCYSTSKANYVTVLAARIHSVTKQVELYIAQETN